MFKMNERSVTIGRKEYAASYSKAGWRQEKYGKSPGAITIHILENDQYMDIKEIIIDQRSEMYDAANQAYENQQTRQEKIRGWI